MPLGGAALYGATADALDTIGEALVANPEELCCRPEAFRMRGELRLKTGEDELAEADFREAIALAQKIGAKAWELRAAMSLAQFLKALGDRTAAREFLAPV